MKDEGWQDERWQIQDERWQMIRWNMTDTERKNARWNMTDDKERHDIFPEDDILDIITISRYNYHK